MARLDLFLPPGHIQQVAAEATRLGQGFATVLRAIVVNRLQAARGGNDPLPPAPPAAAPMVRKPLVLPDPIAATLAETARMAGYGSQSNLVRAIVEEWCGPPRSLTQWVSCGRLTATDAATLQGWGGALGATGILIAGPVAAGKTLLLCALLSTIVPPLRATITAFHPLRPECEAVLGRPSWCTLVFQHEQGLDPDHPVAFPVVEAAIAAGTKVVAIDALEQFREGFLRLALVARQAGATVIATRCITQRQQLDVLYPETDDVFPHLVWVDADWQQGGGRVHILPPPSK